ncbi:hypothetical protein FB565_002933 [Actinoplanes lutulentus]|uniref:hypothetical protein n=1 Tax=Actinoplanes lutulentus TaxID=1287878 RepID=UPI0011B94B58|nr:hypothetical protein [Actinoplanes lutulentus]MBB2943220.1 hypothetical protein [Actinoplanes lutulentus]
MSAEPERYDRLLALYSNRVAGYEGVADDYPQRWSRWCRHLLQYGGELVVPHRHPEHHLDELLACAAVQPTAGRFVLTGRSRQSAPATPCLTTGCGGSIFGVSTPVEPQSRPRTLESATSVSP